MWSVVVLRELGSSQCDDVAREAMLPKNSLSRPRTNYAPVPGPLASRRVASSRHTGRGIPALAVLVRRICKVVCKVAILDKKKPEPLFT
jgi:hypothetical protein